MNTQLENNNNSLEEILATVESLPEAGGSSGGGAEPQIFSGILNITDGVFTGIGFKPDMFFCKSLSDNNLDNFRNLVAVPYDEIDLNLSGTCNTGNWTTDTLFYDGTNFIALGIFASLSEVSIYSFNDISCLTLTDDGFSNILIDSGQNGYYYVYAIKYS